MNSSINQENVTIHGEMKEMKEMNRKHDKTAQSEKLVHCECPDYDRNKQVCLASTSLMIPSRTQQMNYCATDDYDNCPIYLCKALRSSRPQGLDRDSLVGCGK